MDIAKHVIQVHGADAAGYVLLRKRITRVKLLGFPPQGKPGARQWKPVPVRTTGRVPFVKRQKVDAADGEAICEAAQRPRMSR